MGSRTDSKKANEMTAIELPNDVYEQLWRHLLQQPGGDEEAAFVFVRCDTTANNNLFRYMEWLPVPPDGFESRSPFHFELTDETRAAIIKRAHDLGASIVEFHSHTGPWPPQFSPSDWVGFEEVVPHMWWRLKARPYAAVVVSHTGFDALIWLNDPNTPVRLGGILIEGQTLEPSRLSPLEREGYERTF